MARNIYPDRVLAIIPARGGSKGIARKNIVPIHGKPLLTYTVEAARNAATVGRTVVSTDDAAIAQAGAQSGAEIIWRPPDISGDLATSESALVHVLDHLAATEQYIPELVVFLQATSPLRPAGAIDRAVETLIDEGADSLFSSSPQHGFLWRRENGDLTSFSYDHRNRRRRQDSAEDLVENGSIYVFRPHILRSLNNRLGGRIATYVMPAIYGFQVDEPDDLDLCELLLSNPRYTSSARPQFSAVKLLALDFDGVLTDNRVVVDQDGRESVTCSRSDGQGIAMLKARGIQVIVISRERNSVVDARCRKLGVNCFPACDDKLGLLQNVADDLGVSPLNVCYVGNDIHDVACLRWAGISVAVADAESATKHTAAFVTSRNGGYGAVREVVDWLLEANVTPHVQARHASADMAG